MRKISVKFYGFEDAERLTLDTVFRLSESRETVYSAWTPQSTEAPEVLLIEGDSWEAVLALANPAHDALKLIWVGEDPPPHAWRVFPAPVRWPAVIEALDEEFAPPEPASMDLDLDLQEDDLRVQLDEADNTEPAALGPDGEPTPSRRVLLVDASPESRFYLRAKLAVAGLFDVDEAVSGAQALAFLRTHAYALAMVDLDVPDMDRWQLLKAMENNRPVIGQVFVMRENLTLFDDWRARFAGARVSLRKPLDPGRLKELLQNI